jgi:hypothetical protein
MCPASVDSEGKLLSAWEARLPPDVRRVWNRVRGNGPAGLAEALPGGWRLEADPYGGGALFSGDGGTPRRWAEWDRHGHPHSLCAWELGRVPPELSWAAVRLPAADGAAGWALWEPGTAAHPLWGRCDRVVLLGEAATLTRVASQPFGALGQIPALERPAALPPGAGEALLNLLAALMRDQRRAEVHYRGPFPTPHLFEALCRSFTPGGPLPEARERFSRDALELSLRGRLADNPVAWTPAPWQTVQPAPGLLVRLRNGPESLWIGGVPFRAAASLRKSPEVGLSRRSHDSTLPLHAGERLWPGGSEPGGEWVAGLALLGAPYREFVVLDPQGQVLRHDLPSTAPEPAAPLSPLWHECLFAWSAVQAAPPLAPGVLALRGRVILRWARLPLTLANSSGDEVWLNLALAEQFARLRPTRDPAQLALMAFSDAAGAVAPHLHRRAQAALEAQAPPDLAPLMTHGAEVQRQARAALAEALPKLIASIAGGGGFP